MDPRAQIAEAHAVGRAVTQGGIEHVRSPGPRPGPPVHGHDPRAAPAPAPTPPSPTSLPTRWSGASTATFPPCSSAACRPCCSRCSTRWPWPASPSTPTTGATRSAGSSGPPRSSAPPRSARRTRPTPPSSGCAGSTAGVRGVAPDGRPYSAADPDLVTWVHAAEVSSFLAAARVYAPTAPTAGGGRRLPRPDGPGGPRPRRGRRPPVDGRPRRLLRRGPAPAPPDPRGPDGPQLRPPGSGAVAARGRHLRAAGRCRPGRPARLGPAPAPPARRAGWRTCWPCGRRPVCSGAPSAGWSPRPPSARSTPPGTEAGTRRLSAPRAGPDRPSSQRRPSASGRPAPPPSTSGDTAGGWSPARARTSSNPWRRQSISTSGSGTAAVSMLQPMQHVPR